MARSVLDEWSFLYGNGCVLRRRNLLQIAGSTILKVPELGLANLALKAVYPITRFQGVTDFRVLGLPRPVLWGKIPAARLRFDRTA